MQSLRRNLHHRPVSQADSTTQHHHQSGSSSPSSSSSRRSSPPVHLGDPRQQAYSINLGDHPSDHRPPQKHQPQAGSTSTATPSLFANNYHAQAGHQAFSTPPSSHDELPGLPTYTPPLASEGQRYLNPTSDPSRWHNIGMAASDAPSPYGIPGAGRSRRGEEQQQQQQVGEDKLSEKMAANGADAVYGRGGVAPVSGGSQGSRYANMLPVQAPPQTPLEHLSRLFEHEHFCTALYFALGLITRLYRIGKSPTVIWDEAHFGKFGSHYLKHEFYFDVHPPLGKMLVGLAGALSGYNGSFEFKSGEHYPDDSHYYVGMRIMLAMFGVVMVPLAWSSSGALGWNRRSRHLLALMVLCDNAWLVISRFILLDSMLLCFTFTTVHGLLMFNQHQHRPFSDKWWFWLTFTGFSIGCVASVKWVGLFAMALVGMYTVEDLWDKFGDLKMPIRTYARHWCARGLCLIVIPACVYLTSFKLHFMILSHSGPGDAQMSSLFQAHLRGNDFSDSPLEAAFGSKVTFKNMGYGGGLLHSHVQTYPQGSQQQQVTCYHYKDTNNEFIITPRWEDPHLPAEDAVDPEPPRMLKNGDTVRLVHAQTGRNLHSHKVAAPVTKENYEISGYGNDTLGDSNDYWVVEVVDDMHLGKPKPGQVVRSLTSRIRFRHQNLNCYMRAANAVLPQWGWKQVEVSCDKENNPKDEHTYWNIESHWNDRLPAGNAKLYKSPFFRDFIHLNVAMMTSNNALVPDDDKEDILASKPWDWPFLWNGLRMNSWADNSTKYYLIGNPVIWWGSSVAIIAYILTLLGYLARMQRRYADLSPADFHQFLFVGKIGFFGWFLHYLPFTIMARVCYIHHYLPTLYFATILYVHMLDHFLFNDSTARYRLKPLPISVTRVDEKGTVVTTTTTSSVSTGSASGKRPMSERTRDVVFVVCASAIVGVFWYFYHTALGIDGPIHQYSGRQWRKNWNIYDN